ncbi:MAG: HDOD domain-containing protein [Candidatus Eisenbacteria bacterium]|uniref:HDOD domain-containing protein n=1 Tax=Eiseniibacteriota bacterium TaxID=2212470 RepID=A0A956LYP3_UNCEI|nr:HDOD domain-containing protein [Candidatus Eisenbacteria bacterium]
MKPIEKVVTAADLQMLPPISPAASKVLKLLDDPKADAVAIQRVIQYDPGLTANVLKAANSPYFGFRQETLSLRSAVVRLGSRWLHQVVVASFAKAAMEQDVPGYDLPAGELWRHAVGVSVASDRLVALLGVSVADEIFTAALLHDIGKIVLGQKVGSDVQRIEAATAAGVSFEAAERAVLGLDHAAAGACLLEAWALPQQLVDVVRWHHQPEDAERQSLVLDIVHLADVVCLMLGIGTGRDGLCYRPSTGAMKRLQLKVSDLEAVAAETPLGLEELLAGLNAA